MENIVGKEKRKKKKEKHQPAKQEEIEGKMQKRMQIEVYFLINCEAMCVYIAG